MCQANHTTLSCPHTLVHYTSRCPNYPCADPPGPTINHLDDTCAACHLAGPPMSLADRKVQLIETDLRQLHAVYHERLKLLGLDGSAVYALSASTASTTSPSSSPKIPGTRRDSGGFTGWGDMDAWSAAALAATASSPSTSSSLPVFSVPCYSPSSPLSPISSSNQFSTPMPASSGAHDGSVAAISPPTSTDASPVTPISPLMGKSFGPISQLSWGAGSELGIPLCDEELNRLKSIEQSIKTASGKLRLAKCEFMQAKKDVAWGKVKREFWEDY